MRSVAQNYETIVVNYNGKDYEVKYTAKTTHEISDYGELESLISAMKAGKTISASLQGKTLTITYNLESGNTNESTNGETYTITFAVETETSRKVNSIVESYKNNTKLIPKEIKDAVYSYIDSNNTIVFDAKDPFATVNSLKDDFDLEAVFMDLLTNADTKGLYKSIAIYVNDIEYPITYDEENDKINGLEDLLSDLRLGTTMGELASKNIKVVIGLNNGIMNYTEVKNDKETNEKVYTDGSDLTYNIVISTKISALEVLTKAYKSTKDYNNNFILKEKDGKILVLYGSDLDAIGFFENTSLIGNVRDLLANDDRFKSAEIKIGNQTLEIVAGSTIGASGTDVTSNVNYKIRQYFTALLNKEGSDVIYKADAKMADVVEALGNNEISITLNLKPTYASFTENDNTSVTYQLSFAEYENLKTALNTKFSNKLNEDNEIVIPSDTTDVNFGTYFNSGLLDMLFKKDGTDPKNISSITINGYAVTAGSYASATASAVPETNILVGNILDSIAKQLKDAKISTTISADADQPTTGVTAKQIDLAKAEIKITFTIRMANGVLSENGNSEETYTISFAKSN